MHGKNKIYPPQKEQTQKNVRLRNPAIFIGGNPKHFLDMGKKLNKETN